MIVTSLLPRAWQAVVRMNQHAAAARQLNSLSDHQLRDLGISRDQIDTVVYGVKSAPAKPQRTYRAPVFTLGAAVRA